MNDHYKNNETCVFYSSPPSSEMTYFFVFFFSLLPGAHFRSGPPPFGRFVEKVVLFSAVKLLFVHSPFVRRYFLLFSTRTERLWIGCLCTPVRRHNVTHYFLANNNSNMATIMVFRYDEIHDHRRP